jgi:hypothetical protein
VADAFRFDDLEIVRMPFEDLTPGLRLSPPEIRTSELSGLFSGPAA